MADDAEIYARVTEIFREVFDDDSIVLTPQTTADDIAEWDSFNHVNISVACESAFDIRFRSSELEELHNVGELVTLIKSKL